MSAKPQAATPEQQAFYDDYKKAIAELSKRHPAIGVADMLTVQALVLGFGLAMYDRAARHQLRSRLIQNIDVGIATHDLSPKQSGAARLS